WDLAGSKSDGVQVYWSSGGRSQSNIKQAGDEVHAAPNSRSLGRDYQPVYAIQEYCHREILGKFQSASEIDEGVSRYGCETAGGDRRNEPVGGAGVLPSR